MDRVSGAQKLQGAYKLNQYQFLKKTFQFIISISMFAFFIWYSSGFSILPQSFNFYFSTFLFSMFTHTLERKYMFLICNGILAFLAKSSLSSSPPPISAFNIECEASNLSETKTLPVSEEAIPLGSFESSEDALFMPEEELDQQEEKQEDECEEPVAENDQEDYVSLYPEFEEERNETSSVNAEEEGGETGSGAMEVTQDDDDDEADTTLATKEELANTDELNRKFEEFIRKMKKEIRIEAQRQLIAV